MAEYYVKLDTKCTKNSKRTKIGEAHEEGYSYFVLFLLSS